MKTANISVPLLLTFPVYQAASKTLFTNITTTSTHRHEQWRFWQPFWKIIPDETLRQVLPCQFLIINMHALRLEGNNKIFASLWCLTTTVITDFTNGEFSTFTLHNTHTHHGHLLITFMSEVNMFSSIDKIIHILVLEPITWTMYHVWLQFSSRVTLGKPPKLVTPRSPLIVWGVVVFWDGTIVVVAFQIWRYWYHSSTFDQSRRVYFIYSDDDWQGYVSVLRVTPFNFIIKCDAIWPNCTNGAGIAV